MLVLACSKMCLEKRGSTWRRIKLCMQICSHISFDREKNKNLFLNRQCNNFPFILLPLRTIVSTTES